MSARNPHRRKARMEARAERLQRALLEWLANKRRVGPPPVSGWLARQLMRGASGERAEQRARRARAIAGAGK